MAYPPACSSIVYAIRPPLTVPWYASGVSSRLVSVFRLTVGTMSVSPSMLSATRPLALSMPWAMPAGIHLPTSSRKILDGEWMPSTLLAQPTRLLPRLLIVFLTHWNAPPMPLMRPWMT